MDLAGQLLVHGGGLSSIRGDQGLIDGFLHMTFDDWGNRRGEGPRDVARHIGSKKQPFDFVGQSLTQARSSISSGRNPQERTYLVH